MLVYINSAKSYAINMLASNASNLKTKQASWWILFKISVNLNWKSQMITWYVWLYMDQTIDSTISTTIIAAFWSAKLSAFISSIDSTNIAQITASIPTEITASYNNNKHDKDKISLKLNFFTFAEVKIDFCERLDFEFDFCKNWKKPGPFSEQFLQKSKSKAYAYHPTTKNAQSFFLQF